MQFDDDVFQSSAFTEETMFQQLLSQRTFDTVNEEHIISFVANPDGAIEGQASWVDIDYIVFTNG